MAKMAIFGFLAENPNYALPIANRCNPVKVVITGSPKLSKITRFSGTSLQAWDRRFGRFLRVFIKNDRSENRLKKVLAAQK